MPDESARRSANGSAATLAVLVKPFDIGEVFLSTRRLLVGRECSSAGFGNRSAFEVKGGVVPKCIVLRLLDGVTEAHEELIDLLSSHDTDAYNTLRSVTPVLRFDLWNPETRDEAPLYFFF